jgi:serine/threonine-protein kinase
MQSQSNLDRIERLEALFEAALRKPRSERTAFVRVSCPDDRELREELLSLLRSHDQAETEGFLGEEAFPVAPSPPAGSSLLSRFIGPYRLLRTLGRGGMGEVYLGVREEPFKQYVAVKILRYVSGGAEAAQRFEMERQILASLSHRNIARLVDGGTSWMEAEADRPDLSYLAMEYVDGLPITDYSDRHRLPVDGRLELFLQVCDAVHYAHQNLVVHRDLKPSNILVTESRDVKLLDFGVAKLLNPVMFGLQVPATRTLFRMMTPNYASPEQVRGENVTTASDVYSLGVILYEMLSGHRPYSISTSSPGEIERIVCLDEPAPPSLRVGSDELADGTAEPVTPAAVAKARSATPERLRRRLSGDLDNIVMKALRKEPHLRYSSVEMFAVDVSRHLAGMPVEARRSTVLYRGRKFFDRHRMGVVLSALIAVLLLAGGMAVLWQARLARSERDRARELLARSEAVSGFLMGLFEASDPDESRGDTLSSYELLDRGVRRAEELSDLPRTQAELLSVVGSVYMSLGQFETAEPILERALSLRRQVLGESHADVAASLNQLAYLLDNQARYARAEELYREALAMRRSLPGEDLAEAESLNDLAGLLRRRGRAGEALPLAEEALRVYREHLSSEDVLIAESLNNLGLISQELGFYDSAMEYFRDALTMNRRLLGEGHPDVAINLSNIAYLLRRQGDYDAAEPFAREAVALRRSVYGDTHPRLALSLHNLGSLLHEKGDLAGADSLYREALAMRRLALGSEHPRVAESLNGLALLLSEQGRHAEAEEMMSQSLAMRRRLLGPRHPDIAYSLNNMAVVLRRKGDLPAAQMLVEESLVLRREVLGERHPGVGRALQSLASILRERGEAGRARDLLSEALSIYEETMGEESIRAAEVREALALLDQP